SSFRAMSYMSAAKSAGGSTLFRSVDGKSICWTDCLDKPANRGARDGQILIGVLPGEGVGPEVIGSALQVLGSVAEATGLRLQSRTGGAIGPSAQQTSRIALSVEVIRFCEDIFSCGGAILNGPGGGRYVYDLRKRFDLFFKISPLRIANGLPEISRLKPESLDGMDILLARENTGGAYQGN